MQTVRKVRRSRLNMAAFSGAGQGFSYCAMRFSRPSQVMGLSKVRRRMTMPPLTVAPLAG